MRWFYSNNAINAYMDTLQVNMQILDEYIFCSAIMEDIGVERMIDEQVHRSLFAQTFDNKLQTTSNIARRQLMDFSNVGLFSFILI